MIFPEENARGGLPARFLALAESRRGEMVGFLEGLAKIASPTASKEGVDRAGDFLEAGLPARLRRERIPSSTYGDCRYFEHHVEGVPPFGLMGHLDTVTPEGFDRVEVRGGRMLGPGVADMKGGLAVMVWALRLLEEEGFLARLSIRGLVNTEEEVNSPWSRGLAGRFRGCSGAFVFEMGGPAGDIVTTRIGISVFRLAVRGVAAHAGTGRGPKASAILELARCVDRLEAMNSGDFKVNVGKVEGGKAYNFVPDHAEARLAIRYWDESREADFLERCETMFANPTVPGCSVSMEKTSSRPPLKPTPGSLDLLRRCREAGRGMGLELPGEERSGGSDAAFIAACGVPTLDGLGPVGDHDFSWDEYIDLDSLVQRTALVAAVLAGGAP